MKRVIKAAMYRLAPRAATEFFSARARAQSQRYLAGLGMPELNRRLSDRLGDAVVGGPFAGTRLPPGAWQEQLGPYLLGTFERELHPWIERAVAANPPRVIDVGCKFGYYVAGFARRLPAAEVIGYDTDPWARDQTTEGARLNGVADRVRVRGYCTPAALRADAVPGALIVSDCEGYEAALFPAGSASAFAGVTLLIEMHEAASPGVTARLTAEFRDTHAVERVVQAAHPPAPPGLDFLTPGEVEKAAHEIRGEQEWVLFTPKADGPR